MDSLLASYASSDDENDSPPPPLESEQKRPQNDDASISSKRAGLFGSLPPPRSSSLFNSIPAPSFQSYHPNSESQDDEVAVNPKHKSSTSLFSALPPPKSSASSNGKKVVQFRPPSVIAPKVGSAYDLDDEEDGDELERKKKRSKESTSTTSASNSLSFMLPAPRHSATLGALGSGRRSMLETDVSNDTKVVSSESEHTKDQSNEVIAGHSGAVTSGSVISSEVAEFSDQYSQNYDYSSGFGGEGYAHSESRASDTVGIDAGVDYGAGYTENVDYSYGNGENVVYSNYGDGYANNDNWTYAPTIPESSVVAAESVVAVLGKRGRRDDPSQIIEVKQDELIKNRPREDQVKLTGIAFGPSHQPASSKGKPTKLHKRKHQIGSLYFDMKQKETELAERRAKGFLTKSQTQGKYGW